MVCPECDHEHLGDIPNGVCVQCGADLSHLIAESDAEEAADHLRRSKETS